MLPQSDTTNPLKPNSFLSTCVEQIVALAAMHAVHLVVGRHHVPCVRLLHGRLERRQIDLVQRALVDRRVDAVALVLLVVGGEMLHRRNHAFALHALDIGDAQLPGEIRIFAVAFEVAPPQRLRD